MKLLIFVILTLFASTSYADNNYSGIWIDSQEKLYSIHHSGDLIAVAELHKEKSYLSPFEQGSLVPSNNPLDLAIAGQGFFITQLKDGSFRYTRKGNFKISAQSRIVNSLGEQLVTEMKAPIPTDTIELIIERNGAIFHRNKLGQIIEFDKIKLASIAPKDIRYLANNTYAADDNLVDFLYPEEMGPHVAILGGALESLNDVSHLWKGYMGGLIDNHVTITPLPPTRKNHDCDVKEIYFNNERSANLKYLQKQLVCDSKDRNDLQLIKVF